MLNLEIIRNFHAANKEHYYETDGEILTPNVMFSDLFKLQNAPLKIKPIGFNTIDVLVQFTYNKDNDYEIITINKEFFAKAQIFCKKGGLVQFQDIPEVIVRVRKNGQDWEPYDIEGNSIDDGSVVEFVYIDSLESLDKGEESVVRRLKEYSIEIFTVNQKVLIP